MRTAAHVAHFEHGVRRNLVLHAQIVLIGVRRPQVRIHHEYDSGRVKRQESCGAEVNSRRRRLRGKGIGRRVCRGCERIGEKWKRRIRDAGGIKEQAGAAKERRLPVELQVVLAFQDVIENTEAAADAGFGIAKRIPGKSDARRPVILIRKVRALWRSRISRKHQSNRGVHETLRVRTRNNRERTSFQVELGRVVFIADTQVDGQALGGTPFILEKCISGFAANVGRCRGRLEKLIRRAEQEVRQRVAGSTSEEIEFAVHDEVENGVVLIGRNTRANLEVVGSANETHRVGKAEGVVHEARWSLFTEAERQSVVEENIRRASLIVRSNANAQFRGGRQAGRGLGLQDVVSLHEDAQLIHQVGRKGVAIGQVSEVTVNPRLARKTRHRSKGEWIELRVANSSEGYREFVFLPEQVVGFYGQFVVVVGVRRLKRCLAGGRGWKQARRDIVL